MTRKNVYNNHIFSILYTQTVLKEEEEEDKNHNDHFTSAKTLLKIFVS